MKDLRSALRNHTLSGSASKLRHQRAASCVRQRRSPVLLRQHLLIPQSSWLQPWQWQSPVTYSHPLSPTDQILLSQCNVVHWLHLVIMSSSWLHSILSNAIAQPSLMVGMHVLYSDSLYRLLPVSNAQLLSMMPGKLPKQAGLLAQQALQNTTIGLRDLLRRS